MIVMTEDLENTSNSLYNNQIPKRWSNSSYPSQKSLSSWVIDLQSRVTFIKKWVEVGEPAVFWLAGFFSPQAFLTATLQHYARKQNVSIDVVSFEFGMLEQKEEELQSKPEDGCYITGLFIEGARWDSQSQYV